MNETVTPFPGTFKTMAQRRSDELHEFLINYVKEMTKGKNFCTACGGNKWRPHSNIFPTELGRYVGLIHVSPLPFLLVSCDRCGNTLFFSVTSELNTKYIAFEQAFKERQLPKEESNGL